jgi:hypothetical protein
MELVHKLQQKTVILLQQVSNAKVILVLGLANIFPRN